MAADGTTHSLGNTRYHFTQLERQRTKHGEKVRIALALCWCFVQYGGVDEEIAAELRSQRGRCETYCAKVRSPRLGRSSSSVVVAGAPRNEADAL